MPSPENHDVGLYAALSNQLTSIDGKPRYLRYKFMERSRVDQWSKIPEWQWGEDPVRDWVVPGHWAYGCPLCFQASNNRWLQWIHMGIVNSPTQREPYEDFFFLLTGYWSSCAGASADQHKDYLPDATYSLIEDGYSSSDTLRVCTVDPPSALPVSIVPAFQWVGDKWRGIVEIRDRFTLPSRSDWMAPLPDGATLRSLSIPGTHDSAAFAAPWTALAGWVKTQDDEYAFSSQLNWGARAFDLRLSECMNLYHGIWPLGSVDRFFRDAQQFLADHPAEFVIAFVKDENCEGSCGRSFNDLFRLRASRFFPFVDRQGRTHAIRYAWDPATETMGNLESAWDRRLRGNVLVVTRPNAPNACGFIADTPQLEVPYNDTSAGPTSLAHVDAAVSDDFDRLPQNKIGKLVQHLANATAGRKWHVGYTSGISSSWDLFRPAPFARAFTPALWRYMIEGRCYFLDCSWGSGCERNTDQGLPWVPRDGPLGTVMMDFVGAYYTNEIRDDMLRRNLALH